MAAYIWGYRVALLIATTGVIFAVGVVGWHVALLGVAALIALGLVVTLLAPEPPPAARRTAPAGLAARLAHAVIEPLRDFLTRRGALLILAFVALFKLGEAMAGIMTAPFYRALGFSREAIAATGWFSLGGTLAGIALGGWLVARLGTGRALLRTGWAQTLAMAMYLLLAVSAGEHHVLYATVTTEAFAQGMADAAFITYLSGLCSREFTATHYALLSSLAAIAVHTIGGASGVLAAQVGWVEFYALCMFAALPSMGLMLVLLRRYPLAEGSGLSSECLAHLLAQRNRACREQQRTPTLAFPEGRLCVGMMEVVHPPAGLPKEFRRTVAEPRVTTSGTTPTDPPRRGFPPRFPADMPLPVRRAVAADARSTAPSGRTAHLQLLCRTQRPVGMDHQFARHRHQIRMAILQYWLPPDAVR